MMNSKYETIFARSFSGYEQKRLKRGALFAFCVMAFTLCTVFKPYLPPVAVNLAQSISAADLGILRSTEPNQSSAGLYIEDEAPIIHNLTSTRSQVYELIGDIRIHGISSTIFISQPHNITTCSSSWTTKPYARNTDKVAMQKVSGFQISLQSPDAVPRCSRNFSVPALVFSSGGYTGNAFHDFTDVLIPLYLTSRQFDGRVLFLVTDMHSWWTSKYRLILHKLSRHDFLDIAHVNQVLCFPRMIVGLRAHKDLTIDPSKLPHYSARDFTNFLRGTYSLNRNEVILQGDGGSQGCRTRQPRLLIVSRKKTRRLTNAAQVAGLARSLGFDVVVREMGWPVSEVARLVNSFDVMVGVHGAGLTNMVFLPANAVVIQIVPIRVEGLAELFFKRPAKDMGLRYLEYKVSLNESSLSGKYRQEHDDHPAAAHRGWHHFRVVYLDGQDINLDVGRFRETLSKAMELVCGTG